MRAARAINLSLAALGMAVFGTLFVYVSFAPAHFDRRTQEFVIAEVERRLDDRLNGLLRLPAADRIAGIASQISPSIETRVDVAHAALETSANELIVGMLAAACRPNCERRRVANEALRNFYEATGARYRAALERLEPVVVGQYDLVMAELRADLQIFSGVSFLAMLFAFLLSVFRGRAARHLLPVSLALTASTLIAVFWYVIGQDWLTTVIFADHWGWGYAVWLAILALLMTDIAANKARVTSSIFSGFGGALGPC